jgi:phosphate transport system permease protein
VTTLFDPSRIPSLQQQERTRPWSKRTKKFDASVAVAVLVPLAIVVSMFLFSEIPGALIMVLYLPLQLIASGIAAYITKGKRGIGDSIIIVNAIGASIFSFVVIISVIWSLLSHGLKALSIPFLTQNSTYISPSTPLEYGGIAHAALGTLLIVTISALIAVPIGISTAIYITEVRGKAVPYVRFFVQSMSGVPSVVAGLFILTTLILTGAINTSAFAGGLAYAILMLPTVARTAEEVLRLVPDDLRTGALALGSTRARTVFQVVLPAAKTGIVTAIILGVARVIGETAPLLMTAGKNDATVTNPFSDPVSTLPVSIFENVAQPYPDAVTRAWGSALILMVLVAILFTAARLIGRNKVK